MKNRYAAFLTAVLFTLAFSVTAGAAIPIEVPIGKGSIVSLKKVSKRISLSDPGIADMILISPTEILINGKKVGTTSMIVWDKEGKRTFFDVFVVGDLGELVEQVREVAPDSDITVEMAKDTVYLRGTLKSLATIDKVVALSKAYAPNVLNFLEVDTPEQVMLEVKVAQINKTKLKELGLSMLAKGNDAEFTTPGFVASPEGDLGGNAGFDVIPGIEGFDLESMVPQIGVAYFPAGVAAFLRAMSSKGYAKILAEPNLVVRSGERGHFLAGARIPIQQVTGVGAEQTVSISFEEVGIKLNFAPQVLESGMIRLNIDPAEVSNVSRYLSFQGVLVPEIDTREVSTSVDLKEGESLVLAGLLSEEMRKNITKVPILGDIPILGALFRSTRDELEQTELAFFITPRLVKPLAPGVRPELPGDKPLTPEEEREFRWIPGLGGGSQSGEAE
ncbi:MAG: pilus assembly protein N-terminal domain-containing protein [Thermodesulfobacteriota bacterium]